MTAIVEVEPGRWDDVLDRIGVTDVYCSEGFVRASAALVSAEPVLLHDGGDGVFPVLVREEPTDVVTPYGYGGPIGADSDSFGAAYAEWCGRRGVVSSFVVFHPLFGNDGSAEALGFRRVPLGGTVSWTLTGDLRAGMHRHHRRLVRRAEREGLAATATAAPDELDEFVALYSDAMRRLGASPFYLFGPSYWESLRRDVPLVRVDVRDGGALAASVLGMGRPPWLHYHLGASTADGLGTGASHLALCALAEWGQANGYALLHLGGGVGGRADSLLEYKLRFAPEGLRPSATGRAVHDMAAYARLTGSDRIDWEGFFPAYRAAY